MILLSTNKDEQNDRVLQKILIAYLASIVACVLLSLLVLTVTAFEIGLFQGPERQYESLEKVQVSKIFWGADSPPPEPPAELLTCFARSFPTVIKFVLRTLKYY